MHKLLTRDEFRNGVFARDQHKCVICGRGPADGLKPDAHHIIERRLFDDGGYYLDNGASLCSEHHIQAEQTVLSCEQVREAAGITKVVLPEHLYEDERYDKWGNVILPNCSRLRGELFWDESVQKILKEGGGLHLFTHYVKGPRTYHLPWSPGMTKDDKMMGGTDEWIGQDVVVTLKMDGEQTSCYRDHIHARSIESRDHDSQHWVKGFWSQWAHEIPEGWRVQGENVFAKHSIHYTNLPSYFFGIFVWNDRNVALSYNETLEWFDLLDITAVPLIWRGVWTKDSEKEIQALWKSRYNEETDEGYVIRLARPFHYREFRKAVGKYVRKGHVTTDRHWKAGRRLEPNLLAS